MNQGEENCEGGDEVDAGHDQGQGEGDGRHEEGEGEHVEQQATKKSERRDMMLILRNISQVSQMINFHCGR